MKEIKEENSWPMLKDKFAEVGKINNYFWGDLWAARLIFQNMSQMQCDIGLRLDGLLRM